MHFEVRVKVNEPRGQRENYVRNRQQTVRNVIRLRCMRHGALLFS